MKTHGLVLAVGVLALLSFIAIAESRRLTDAEKCEMLIETALDQKSTRAAQELNFTFTQRLDHFDLQDDRTWTQRYFVQGNLWAGDGAPIFLALGGESPSSATMVTSRAMTMYAAKHKALQVGIEHRYYGESQPFEQLTTENLKWLSSQQALADAAALIKYIKKAYNAPNSPVITFGCSYSGALSAWFRLKYPHLTLGSVASSAPVEAMLDFHQYLEVVDKSLNYFGGSECSATIASATQRIQAQLPSGWGRSELSGLFKTCEPLAAGLDSTVFMQNLMGNWQGLVQYNLIRPGSYNVSAVCEHMARNRFNGMSSSQAYYEATKTFWPPQPCMDCKYSNMVKDTQHMSGKTESMRQWTYQTCTEFAYFQTTDSNAQPFGNQVPVSFWIQFCKDVYGADFNPAAKVEMTNDIYGGSKLPTFVPNNILFVNGNIDPWHSLSIYEPIPNSPIQTILVDGTSHCADSSLVGDRAPPQLQVAQQKISDIVGQWISNNKP